MTYVDRPPWGQYLLAIVCGLIILYFGKSLFIPLSFAFLISLILHPIVSWLSKKGWRHSVAIGTALGVLSLFVVALGVLLSWQFYEFIDLWPTLRLKLDQQLDQLMVTIEQSFNVSLSLQSQEVKNTIQKVVEYLLNWLPQGIYEAAVNLVLLMLVPFYAALILYYRQNLMRFMHYWFPKWSFVKLQEVAKKSIQTYFQFIKGVALVYLIVGLLNSIGLWMLGVPSPFLFGFIASILTFIPYIGITVGALLPITIAWISFGSWWYPLGVVGVFVFTQILEANVIFPLVVSQHMKINTLSAIIAIVLGGILWGAAGMILFLPFLAMIKLLLDHSKPDAPWLLLLKP